MSSNPMLDGRTQVHAHLGWAGTLTAVWSLAGGIAGGMLIALLLLAGRMHPQGALVFAVALALLGSLLGTVHGAVLGRLSRPHEDASDPADPLLTVLAIATAFVFAIGFAVWLALAAVLARAGHLIGWLALGAVVVCSFALLLWATLLGWQAFERAYHRWPDHRLGVRLVLGAAIVLLVGALGLRPVLPGTDLQLSASAYVFVAALATLWIATPVVIVALRWTHLHDRD